VIYILKLLSKIRSEQGFSLIEVVASIVIVSILLISFAQLFIQTNKTAAYNNEKLVTINLADAALAKLQAETFAKNPNITNVNHYFIDNSITEPALKNPPLAILLNGKIYSITYTASQNNKKEFITNSTYSEKELDLIKVVVTVTAPEGKIKGSSEGYVSLE
jgi:prepilin-type N-terminal cleavage/methylation domain-containing protein